ncbi:MAG: hypothetical protein QE263_02020 [Vampirovibrionales bacterium]|nr:hypothetical protein [Vampirovibrionales bacterium]
MSLEKDPADKEVVPQLLDDSLASTIIKITFWPVIGITFIAFPIHYPWALGFNYDVFFFLRPWSNPVIIFSSIFGFYSFAKLLYLKNKDIKYFKITMDISILSILTLLAQLVITYDCINFFCKGI